MAAAEGRSCRSCTNITHWWGQTRFSSRLRRSGHPSPRGRSSLQCAPQVKASVFGSNGRRMVNERSCSLTGFATAGSWAAGGLHSGPVGRQAARGWLGPVEQHRPLFDFGSVDCRCFPAAAWDVRLTYTPKSKPRLCACAASAAMPEGNRTVSTASVPSEFRSRRTMPSLRQWWCVRVWGWDVSGLRMR